MKIIKLVLIRHGESEWNKLNKFTGWHDVGLSQKGKKEANNSGKLLKKYGFTFDLSYTSVLKRAIHTLWYILKELEISWIPTKKSWHLNERHYGSLQGLNKIDAAKKYGNETIQLWRRGFYSIPPKLNISDPRYPGNDIRYSNLKKSNLPLSESLELTSQRVIPYWKEKIFPNLQDQKKIIIVAHGNSLRALLKYLADIDDASIVNINIPTGIPIVYEFNQLFIPIRYYLLNQ